MSVSNCIPVSYVVLFWMLFRMFMSVSTATSPKLCCVCHLLETEVSSRPDDLCQLFVCRLTYVIKAHVSHT